ncbi:MAG: hypothetical protein IJZ67_07645 [Alistipes sp.]|nr:hypothetical protein [Alistipes sp.]
MKNIFRFLMAVALLFTASCAKEDISSSIAGGEVEVTFTASLPELGTRAYGDGAKANFLQVNVYDAANDQLLPELRREVDATGTRTFTFQLVLLKGMKYDIVLWADVKDNSFYTLNGKDVAVTYGTAANDDNRDAFYAYIDSFDPTSDEPAFTLYRPFAQLNAAVLASDVEAAQKSGVALTTSALKTKAYSALNLENNAATNEVEVTFTEAAIPTEKWNNADEYKHLSMNYLLVPSAGHVAKVEFTFKGKRADDSEVTFTGTTYDNVPFKQNYRTNILGALLTKPTDFTVTIDADFDEPAEEKFVWNGSSTMEPKTNDSGALLITNEAEFAWLSKKVFTGENTIEILNDLDMQNSKFEAMVVDYNAKLTVNGNNHTISNLSVLINSAKNNGTMHGSSLFNTLPNGNLTVNNIVLNKITSDNKAGKEDGWGYAAAVISTNEGVAVLNNVDVTNSTIKGMNGVAATVGFAAATGSLNLTDCDVNGCNISNYPISGESGYIAGIIGKVASANTVTGSNVTIANSKIEAIYASNRTADSIAADIVIYKPVYTHSYTFVTVGSGVVVEKISLENGIVSASSQSDLNNAISNTPNDEKSIITLAEGTYTIPSAANGKTLTISGTEDTKIDVTSGLTYVNGADITFEGVTIQSKPNGFGYENGFADMKYATFNKCVLNGTLGLDFTCEFNECTFNIAGNYYNVWTWGAGTATFNKCTFNCDGKALLVYANVLDNGTTHQTINISECIFNDNGDDTVTGKAAIEVSNTYTPIRTYDVIIDKTTVNGFAQTVPGAGDFNAAYGSVTGANIGNNVWGNKCQLSSDYLNVVIDGVDVY